MIKNLIRTCDLCHRQIPTGQYMPRFSERNGSDVQMVLAENQDRDLQLIELPDGSISMDTCRTCYIRMPFSASTSLN
jgi:hypothetical protein